jgi:hypothetical protein
MTRSGKLKRRKGINECVRTKQAESLAPAGRRPLFRPSVLGLGDFDHVEIVLFFFFLFFDLIDPKELAASGSSPKARRLPE